MTPTRPDRRRLLQAGSAAALLAASGGSLAQAFPTRPITLIVPFPAGGSTDRHFRLLAELAGKHLGQNVVVENRPGGGGTTGPGNMALNARPDGYTIAQFPMGMLRVPHMQKTPWNPIADFTFIIGISGYTFGVTVRADSRFKSFKEYIEAARKAPGQIDYGSTGIGSSPHLHMEELAANAGVTLNHVPFKGNADLTQALLAHQALAHRAHRAGARLRRGLDLTLRPVRAEGHGPRRGEDPARRVQEGDGRPEAPRAAGATEPGPVVPEQRCLCAVGARHLREGKALHREARAGGQVSNVRLPEVARLASGGTARGAEGAE